MSIYKRPSGWNPLKVTTPSEQTKDRMPSQWELDYPLTIQLVSGEKITFKNYKEHTEHIQKLFKPKPNAKLL